jgi:hypothetical protein
MSKGMGGKVVKLFSREAVAAPEMPLDMACDEAPLAVSSTGSAAVVLRPGPKVWFVFGRGRCGKSTFLKWQIGRAAERDGVDDLVLADMDRKSLKLQFPGVEVPPSPAKALVWLERLLSHLMERKLSAAIDFAADATLLPLLARIPNLASMMSDAGVEPVAFYLLGPSQVDLTALNLMEAAGFQPAATCLVLNMGTMKTSSPVAEFAAVRGHSVYKHAIERGAVEAWMPYLEEAPLLENHRLGFWDATNNAGSSSGLDWLGRHAVSTWLGYMEKVSEPWASWHLP